MGSIRLSSDVVRAQASGFVPQEAIRQVADALDSTPSVAIEYANAENYRSYDIRETSAGGDYPSEGVLDSRVRQ